MAEPAAPRSVFITGALGFIGRALGERLRALGSEVTGVDVRAEPALGVVAGDVAERGPWQEAARGAEAVVHTAAIVSLRSGAERFWRTNVQGTRHVVEAAAGARRLVHLSSVTVFGFDFPDGVDELHPVRPNGVPYVDTKVASEQVVLQAHAAGEVGATIVRPGDVYGPGSRPWTEIPATEIAARRFLLPAMGRGVFSPVFIDNLVEGLVLAAATDAAAGQVLTLTDGLGVECRDFFGRYARMLGRRGVHAAPTAVAVGLAGAVAAAARVRGADTEIAPAAARYLTRTGTYSIARAREVVGYEPAVGLDEGMRRSEVWLRERGIVG